MRRLSTTLAATLTLILGASSAFAGESYVRLQQDPNNANKAGLQTAVGTFTHPQKPGLEIILYGVVHIADMDYYKAIQRDLDSYDKVLFEGVAPSKGYKPTKQDKGLGDMQKMMAEMLGLSFQKKGIDYKRKHFVHADMTIDQLKKALGGGSLNPMGGLMQKNPMMQGMNMGKMAKQFMKAMPQLRDRFKMMMAKQLANADAGAMKQMMGGKFGQVILIERNKVVMKVLKRELAKKSTGKVAIFYGAAHNPDLEQRLAKLGFTMKSKRWMTAWKISGSTKGGGFNFPGMTPRQPKVAPQPRVRPRTTPKRRSSSGPRWF